MDYRFSELVDTAKLQALFDIIYESTGIAAGVADIDGSIITKTGWTDLCSIFHRGNYELVHRCIDSTNRITGLVSETIKDEGEYIYYNCINGLTHAVVPIFVQGDNIAVVYKSQFFLKPPDLNHFRNQAIALGLPENEYLDKVKEIPVYSKKKMDKFMKFASYIAMLFGEMGYKQLRLFQEQEKSKNRYEELISKHEELMATYEEIGIIKEELNNQLYKIEHQEEDLKASEWRYQLATEGSNDVLWDWDALSNIMTFPNKIYDIIGYGLELRHISFDEFKKIIHPNDGDRVYENLFEHIEGIIPYFRSEFRLRTVTDEYKWVLCQGIAMRDDEGKVLRMGGSITDISERKRSEEQLRYLAYYDNATGLPNRLNIRERLHHSLIKAQMDDTSGALLFLDIDNFKIINDTFGHSFGDKVLKQLGERLQGTCGKNNIVARFGGDEFVILKPVIEDEIEIRGIIANIMQMLKDTFVIDNFQVFPKISIGVTIFPKDGNVAEIILRNADIAMYEAKKQGHNSFEFFNPSMNDDVILRMEMERDLRLALEREEFELFYQPQIHCKTGRIESVEALIRWNHPDKGLLSPNQFIPFAEDIGFIVSIGEWVIRTACKQNKIWQDKGYSPICVSVNISALQLRRWDFVDLIQEVLEDVGLNSNYLELEITESKLMESLEGNIVVLHRLREMGVKLALDDFGTGYSSLNYLQRLPINNLKIDRSFVKDITIDKDKEYIAEFIIKLAHRMNLMVTAEGVETIEQLDMLANEGCDRMQGYLFSKPLPIDQIELLINRGKLDF